MYSFVKVICVAAGKQPLNQIVVDFDDDVISLVVSEDRRPRDDKLFIWFTVSGDQNQYVRRTLDL